MRNKEYQALLLKEVQACSFAWKLKIHALIVV